MDDDPGHVYLLEKALRSSGLTNPLRTFGDGYEYLAFHDDAGRLHPEPIVLLDLNMPGISGRQVLRRLKSNAATASLPVFILTTSRDPSEREDCLRLGCAGFFSKPLPVDGFRACAEAQGLALGFTA